MELIMPLSIFAFILFLTIRKFRKYKQNGIELLDAYRDMPHTLNNIEIDVEIMDSDLFNRMNTMATYKTKAFMFDKFLYIDQCTAMMFSRNNKQLVFPLVLCPDSRELQANHSYSLIAKVKKCYFTPWNSLKIRAYLVQNGNAEMELNILFLENKNENSRRLMQILNPTG